MAMFFFFLVIANSWKKTKMPSLGSGVPYNGVLHRDTKDWRWFMHRYALNLKVKKKSKMPTVHLALIICQYVCICHVRLCNHRNCSLLGSPVHGIFQARCWSGLPFPPSGYLPDPGIQPASPKSPALAGGLFTTQSAGTPNMPVYEILKRGWR